MITTLRNYDSSLHTVTIGSCAPGPLIELATVLPNLFPDYSFSSSSSPKSGFLHDGQTTSSGSVDSSK